MAAYEKELAANAKAYRAAFNLAKLLQQTGPPREALERFRQVATLAPDFAIGRLYLAKVLLDTGDLAGAEREAKAGLSLSPDPSMAPLGHYVLADAYNRQGAWLRRAAAARGPAGAPSDRNDRAAPGRNEPALGLLPLPRPLA
jgi:predicted Zn-dependent protease